MSLAQIIYVSSLRDDSESAVRALARHARINNISKSITGMLLCCDGNIVQIIEGERETVSQLFALIRADARHSNVFLILDSDVKCREFETWTTGLRFARRAAFKQVADAGWVFNLEADEIHARVKPGLARSMLTSLSSGMGI